MKWRACSSTKKYFGWIFNFFEKVLSFLDDILTLYILHEKSMNLTYFKSKSETENVLYHRAELISGVGAEMYMCYQMPF